MDEAETDLRPEAEHRGLLAWEAVWGGMGDGGYALGMRAFIAIEIDSEVRGTLARVREEGLVRGSGVRWTKAERLHLTLRFLGAVEEDGMGAVVGGMRSAVVGTSVLALTARGLGCFPNLRAPRVLWAGLEEAPGLLALSERVEQECRALGFAAEERPFRSHITLARIAGRVVIDRARMGLDRPVFGSWRVPRLVLMESQLSPHGSRYTVREEVALGG